MDRAPKPQANKVRGQYIGGDMAGLGWEFSEETLQSSQGRVYLAMRWGTLSNHPYVVKKTQQGWKLVALKDPLDPA